MTGGPLSAGTLAAPPRCTRPMSSLMAMKLWQGRLPVTRATLRGIGVEDVLVLLLRDVVLTVPMRLPMGTDETNRLVRSLACPLLEDLQIMDLTWFRVR